MEFWAVEVKCGETLKVEPDDGMVIHLSQASIGEIKKEKGNESICLFVNVDGKKLVLATLFSDKLPQQQFDLVFDRDFELSHNWKNGNVYFYGYRAQNPEEEKEEYNAHWDSESDDDIPLVPANNGKAETKTKEVKPVEVKKANAEKDVVAGKQKVKIVEPNPEHDDDSDDSMPDDDDDDDDDESGDEDEDGSDSEEDESDESDEETPKKVETSKKRAADSAVKTPGSDKKAKVATPRKTDGKKSSGHVATPHPSKQAGKNKNQQSGGGSFTCKSCNRGFGSEKALESHTKAKHSAGK